MTDLQPSKINNLGTSKSSVLNIRLVHPPLKALTHQIN